ncbi:MAG: L-histidine N(alpha)-methyltransferase [Gammaproteobacteria bacterium]|nr:L-histidine N(alpha)-methyltransferase [Gammaproteobacteria bacterium]
MNSPDTRFIDLHPSIEDMATEVLRGLRANPKTISPKFFYDAEGSQLFDQICELPEYYPTRTEIGLLEQYREEIASLIGTDTDLIELGSGSSTKIRVLIDAIRPRVYMPLDISRDHLMKSAEAIAADHPWLQVNAICVDYTRPFDLPIPESGHRRVAFFPGSSIGNFEPRAAERLLRQVAEMVSPGGGLLIGVDLKKPRAWLERAYNDSAGVTAAFNKNLLTRLNTDLDGTFDSEQFSHQAFYNTAAGRIEMHLRSEADQVVELADEQIPFAAGETIHTENSYKYSIEEFSELAAYGGFETIRSWQDDNSLFSLHYLQSLSTD